MRPVSLSDLLPDFGAHLARPAQGAGQRPPEKAEPPLDVDTLVAEAVARAEAAQAARLGAEHAGALEAQRQADAAAAAAAMESLGKDLGASIADGIAAMEARLAASVEEAVARMLGGVLCDDLRGRALDALARTIGSALGDAEAVRICVSGPQSLFEPLRAALGAGADRLQFTEAPGFDLAVSIDDAVFETRMSEWAAALSEVLS